MTIFPSLRLRLAIAASGTITTSGNARAVYSRWAIAFFCQTVSGTVPMLGTTDKTLQSSLLSMLLAFKSQLKAQRLP